MHPRHPHAYIVMACLWPPVSSQAGFEALYFGRIDYQDREKRIAESDMEMIWRPSHSLGNSAQIFTGRRPICLDEDRFGSVLLRLASRSVDSLTPFTPVDWLGNPTFDCKKKAFNVCR